MLTLWPTLPVLPMSRAGAVLDAVDKLTPMRVVLNATDVART